MSDELARLLNLELAWGRVRDDLENRVFVRHPYEMDLIEIDRDSWLSDRQASIRSGGYFPSAMIVCDVPKAKGGIRPGAHLQATDRLVYAACVGACLENVHAEIRWAQGVVDFAYQLAATPRERKWLRSQFAGWEEFRECSLRKLEEGFPYVVITDISAFYDNIDVATLISDLRQIGVPQALIDQIGRCLNRWGLIQGRGIPQGQGASDILAKLYLNSVDKNLRALGYQHYRYVDDFRIFCRDKAHARKAIMELTQLLRQRGLTLQTAKSEIYTADEARERIEGVLPILKSVARQFVAQVVQAAGVGNPYMTVPRAEEILLQNPTDAPLELIRSAYKAYIVESDNSTFNSTLFRFLLNRLAAGRDRFAQQDCVPLPIC